MKLQGKTNVVLNLIELENESGVCGLRLATRAFFTGKYKDTNRDIERLLDCEIRAYGTLQVPVPRLSEPGFILHHAICSGKKEFRGSKRNDWVWVRRHLASDTAQAGTLNGRISGRLNVLFKLTSKGIVITQLSYGGLWVLGRVSLSRPRRYKKDVFATNTSKAGYEVQVYQDTGLQVPSVLGQVPSCCVRKEEEKGDRTKGREASLI